MKTQILTVLLVGLLAGCATRKGDTEDMIISSDKADFAAQALGQKGLMFWTPSKSDVAETLPKILAFLREEAPSLAGQFGQYRRQFIGIIVEGRKQLYCSFFRLDARRAGGRARAAGAAGAGPSAFQLTYDLETRQCVDLRIRGE